MSKNFPEKIAEEIKPVEARNIADFNACKFIQLHEFAFLKSLESWRENIMIVFNKENNHVQEKCPDRG